MYACLFDIDGTLLSSGGAGKHAMYEALRAEFDVAELNDGVPFAGRTDRAIGRDLLRVHGIDDTPENWHRFCAAYLRLLPASLASRSGGVLPGVASLLDLLRSRDDVEVGLLTGNLRDGARHKLEHYGIYHHFAFGGFGDIHFDRNDVAADAAREVERHTGRPWNCDRMWVIGDTPYDVRCARSIGARVLAVSTGLHSLDELAAERPDLLFADLSEPATFLAAMQA
jgi:phosphoglycolate phosphatase-like HAD superfamily hydrolase